MEFTSLSLRLLRIGVNAACDEQFLSISGIVHSKTHNRLDPERVTEIVKMKTTLSSQQPVAGSLSSFVEPVPRLERVPTFAPEVDEIDGITIPGLIFDQAGIDAEANKWLGEIALECVATMNEASQGAPRPFTKRTLSKIFVSTLVDPNDEIGTCRETMIH